MKSSYLTWDLLNDKTRSQNKNKCISVLPMGLHMVKKDDSEAMQRFSWLAIQLLKKTEAGVTGDYRGELVVYR